MKAFFKTLSSTMILSFSLLLLCGFAFPLALTGVGQLFFPRQANGSLLEVNGVIIGSAIIGQDFTDARFFKCRPSAVGYNTYVQADTLPDANGKIIYSGPASGSQNLAPSNTALAARIEHDMAAFLAANPTIKRDEIPTDLMTASGSGLDPHISVASAKVQIPAISKVSGISAEDLQKIVDNHTTKKLLGIFGEETVNVLEVNLELAQRLALI